MPSVLMTTRLPCVVCASKHRTHSQRIAGGQWVVVCVSCRAALERVREWHAANPALDVTELLRVYVECVPKPASVVAAAARKKTA